MPFTFAHPIYAIPLKYISPKYISITGLVLGSMSPDFEYFLMLEPYATIGHSISGLFIQAIPMSILLAILFHFVVKESLAIHLPSVMRLDLRAYNLLGEWRLSRLLDWIIFIASVVLGFVTHIVVDAFTHAHGYFVIQLPLLSTVLFFDYPLYKLLQYSLSLLGLLSLMGIAINHLYKSNPVLGALPKVTMKQKWFYWIFVFTVSAVVTGLKIILTSSNNIIGIVVVAPITGFCLGIFLASLIKMRRGSSLGNY